MSYPYIAQSKDSERLFALLVACVKAAVPLGLVGNPGAGKTATMDALAEATGREMINKSLSTMPPEDVSGIPAPVKMKIGDREVMAAPYTMPDWQQKILANPHSILFLDEFTTAPPSTQHAFLQIVQDRKFPGSDIPFSRDVAIIIAMNPARQAGGTSLDLPIANRFTWAKFDTNYYDWETGFLQNWQSGVKMDMPVKLMTDAEIENKDKKIRNLVVKFMHAAGAKQLSIIPTGSETDNVSKEHDEASKEIFRLAFPTPRSWENLARILARIPDNEMGATEDAIDGTIGVSQGNPFLQFYNEHIKGIDIDEIMAHPERQDWAHMTINDSQPVFTALVDMAKKGNLKEVIDVYAAINSNGGSHLLAGSRVKQIWKHEYLAHYSREEQERMKKKYLHEFTNLMKQGA